MNNLVIYAAGPVDLGQDVPNWRAQLMSKLNDHGLSAILFDPSTAYKHSAYGGKQNLIRSRYIENVNEHALRMANIFVVCLPKNVSSIGTPIELEFAYTGTKKIMLLTDIAPGKSVYLDNRVPSDSWFHVQDLRDKDSMDAALNLIVDELLRYDDLVEFGRMEKQDRDE